MNYLEKLKDPRWQKKRLEIMQRDNFQCTICDDDKITLNVHHNFYKGEPWDVNNKDLITTCVYCHEFLEVCKKEKISIIKVIRKKHKNNDYTGITFYLTSDNMITSISFNENKETEFLLCINKTIFNELYTFFNNG